MPAVSEATTERDLARALALGGWAFDREPVLERRGRRRPARRASRRCSPDLPDPNHAARARCALRRCSPTSATAASSPPTRSRAGSTCSYKWFVEHELDPARLEPTADPLWLGTVVHDALDRLYREAPGADSIPRPGDLDAWQRRFGELLDEVVDAVGGPLNHARRAALARARGPGRGVPRVRGGDRDRRFAPAPTCWRSRSGISTRPKRPGARGRCARRRRRCAGASTGSTSTRPAGAVVRDYKTGKSVTPADKFTEDGASCRSSSTCARPSASSDSTWSAGLYHPLGAVGERKPRGLVAREDEDLKGLGIVGTDRLEHDDFELALDEAEALARDSAAEMRAGEIGRHPIGGRCPKYCNFQAICRLERAIGVDENGNGG